MAKSRKRTKPAKAAPVESTSTIVETVEAEPIHQSIATRAYELFLLRGATHGHDWGDWLAAERELAVREPVADAADYAG
jgi:Protein of unknown function (DUF2934)